VRYAKSHDWLIPIAFYSQSETTNHFIIVDACSTATVVWTYFERILNQALCVIYMMYYVKQFYHSLCLANFEIMQKKGNNENFMRVPKTHAGG
jgi:hypothetical protein